MANYGSRNPPTRLSITAGVTEVLATHPTTLQTLADTVLENGWGDGLTAQPTDLRKGMDWIDPTTRRSYQMKRATSDTGGGTTAADISVEYVQVIHSDSDLLHSADVKVHDKLKRIDSSGRIYQYVLASTRWELIPAHRWCHHVLPEAFVYPAASYAALTQVDGTNFSWKRVVYTDGADQAACLLLTVPEWVKGNALTLRVFGSSSATTGVAKMRAQVLKVAAGALLDNAAGTTIDWDWTPSGTTNAQAAAASAATASLLAAGACLQIKLTRLGSAGGDTLGADFHLSGLALEERSY